MMHVLIRCLHYVKRTHTVCGIRVSTKCLIYWIVVFLMISVLLSVFYRDTINNLTRAVSSPTTIQQTVIGEIKQLNTVHVQHNTVNNVSAQIEQTMLLWIKEIEHSDTTFNKPVVTEGLGNYTCKQLIKKTYKIEDLLCMSAPTFLPEYKNPCWNSDDGQFRCLPYFQIIGMDKSGSTDLFDKIAKHPGVLKNTGVLEKETMWWSWKRYGNMLVSSPIKPQPFNRYLQYFDKAATVIKSKPNENLITGDGTPMDIWDMGGWQKIAQNIGLNEPAILTPHLIKHINPNVKLLIIFRNPVERLYSDYYFLKLGKLTPEAFHKYVVDAIRLLHQCTRRSSLRTCIYSRNLYRQFRARIHLGFYSLFLRDWFKVFPRNQFLILRTEDYSKNPNENLQSAFSFLKIRNLSDVELDEISAAKRKYVTEAKQKAGQMLDKTRVILERLYASYNMELADMLQDEKFSWPKTET